MKKILIINANYYKEITDQILLRIKKELKKEKVSLSLITVAGIFEIPIAIRRNIQKFDAIIAIGCVIKGKTPHFDFISQATTNAIMDLSVQNKKPIGNGVITCLNLKQAQIRKKKGAEATEAVISVLSQK